MRALDRVHPRSSSTASARRAICVQMLPSPVTKDTTFELMRQCDLVVATGSQANVRAAYASGTPAFGVGAGNVASIVDETADLADCGREDRASRRPSTTRPAARRRTAWCWSRPSTTPRSMRSQTHGAVLLSREAKARLQRTMWPDGKLSPQVIGQSAATIAERAGLARLPARQATRAAG